MPNGRWPAILVAVLVIAVAIAYWLGSRSTEPGRDDAPPAASAVQSKPSPSDRAFEEPAPPAPEPIAPPAQSQVLEVSGVVRDVETGLGIAQASVRSAAPDSAPATITDSTGRFIHRLEFGDVVTLLAEHPDYLSAQAEVDPRAPPAVLEIRLLPGLSIEGRVIDSARGQGIEGAQVAFGRLGPGLPRSARSDADGSYRLRGLPLAPPPEIFELRVTKVGFTHDGDALARATSRMDRASRIWQIDFVLKACGQVEGQVFEPNGAPAMVAQVFPWLTLQGTWVMPTGDRRVQMLHGHETLADLVVLSDDAGRFRIDALPSSIPFVLVACRAPFGDARSALITLSPGEKRTDLRLVLESGAIIEGDVRDESGQPIAAASVKVIRLEPAVILGDPPLQLPVADSTTAADGSFRIEGLLAGEFEVAAEAVGWPPAASHPVVLRTGETTRISLRLSREPSTIAGRVTDTGGHPIADAEVSFFPEDLSPGTSFFPTVARTGAVGRYRTASLKPDQRYRAGVEGPKRGPRYAAGSRKRIAPGSEDVDFVLHRVGGIRGSIRGIDPVPNGTRVTAYIPDPQTKDRWLFGASARVTGSAYEATDLSPGSYQVYAMLPDGRRAERGPIQIDEGDEIGSVDILFGAGNALRGRVEDDRGSPIAGGDVALFLADEESLLSGIPLMRSASGADGRFAFEDVRDGRFAIVASFEGLAPAVRGRIEVPRDATARVSAGLVLRLTLGGWIDGTVLDADTGRPIAEALVAAFVASEAFPLIVRSDSQGRFRIRVPSGSTQVLAARDGSGPDGVARSFVEVTEGAEVRLTLSLRRSN